MGFDIVRAQSRDPEMPLDFDETTAATIRFVRDFTMTPDTRVFALCEAVRYVERAGIRGAFVECGVWRGGSMMAAARTLLEVGQRRRELYLFDTFEGMSAPTTSDVTYNGEIASELLADAESEYWCRAGVADVRTNMRSTGYPEDRIHYVVGRVEDTVPGQAPAEIALLRLDTDWYESTRHELMHLYDRVSPGGIVIIDDYGFWQGARKATDEFLNSLPKAMFLHRIDYSGRLLVKD